MKCFPYFPPDYSYLHALHNSAKPLDALKIDRQRIFAEISRVRDTLESGSFSTNELTIVSLSSRLGLPDIEKTYAEGLVCAAHYMQASIILINLSTQANIVVRNSKLSPQNEKLSELVSTLGSLAVFGTNPSSLSFTVETVLETKEHPITKKDFKSSLETCKRPLTAILTLPVTDPKSLMKNSIDQIKVLDAHIQSAINIFDDDTRLRKTLTEDFWNELPSLITGFRKEISVKRWMS